MPLRIILFGLIGVAAVLLGVAGFTMLQPVPEPVAVATAEAAPVRPVTVKLLVAARPLNAGSLLKPDDVAVREVDPAEVTPELLVEGEAVRNELRGALVRRPISTHEPFTAASVLRPRDRGFLAAVLRPGLRAISVGVDAVSGTAGLIWPGDRVDLLLTQTIEDDKLPLGRRVVGETVLGDIRVLAVDQALTQGIEFNPLDTDGRTARTVTLETTPGEAERIAVASRLGRLALTVRSIDEGVPSMHAPRAVSTFGGDVSPALNVGGPEPRAIAPTMRLHLGGKTEDVKLP